MTRHVSCCLPLSTNNFKNSPCLAFYRVSQRQDVSMKREYVRLLRNANLKLNHASIRICILLVFLKVKSPQAHLLPSVSQFHNFSFFRLPFFSEVSCATHFCRHGYRSIWLANQEGRCDGKLSWILRGSAAKNCSTCLLIAPATQATRGGTLTPANFYLEN